jgi:hypothetical protein
VNKNAPIKIKCKAERKAALLSLKILRRKLARYAQDDNEHIPYSRRLGCLGYCKRFAGSFDSFTLTAISLSLTTNTVDTTPGRFAQLPMAAVVPGANVTMAATIPPYRFSLSGTTTIFLIGNANFSVSTASAYGIIRARRAR